MSERAKPAKSQVEAKRPATRKSPNNDTARVRDLEKRLAEALNGKAETEERQTATSDILRVISQSPTDVQPVFDSLVVSAARLCGANDLILLVREADVLRPAAGVGSFWQSLATDFRVPLVRGTVAARSVIDAETLHFADLATLPEAEYPVGRDLQRRFGHHTVLAVPLMREGVALGTIFAMRFEVRPFVDQQISLLKTFADQAVIAIENVRLFKELQSSNRELTTALDQQTATSEILRVISSSPTDVQPVFDAIVRSASRLCGGEYAIVTRYDGNLLHLAAQYNARPGSANITERLFPRGLGRDLPSARAILNRAPAHIPDAAADPDIGPDVARIARSFLSVPMLREGVPIGAIGVSRAGAGPFAPEQIALMETFADQAVIAIENVRLFNETKEALERQTATSEILRVISQSPTDVQPVFDAIARSAVRLCDGVFGAVFRLDGELIHMVALTGVAPEGATVIRQMFPISLAADSTVAQAIVNRSVVHVSDTESPQAPRRARDAGRAIGFRNQLSVPMLRGGEPIGAVNVSRREPGPYSETQIELLKTFADQAVIAIENVRLFNETKEALQRQTATSEILRVISGSPTDTQPVFEGIARSGVRVCGALGCAVFLIEEDVIRVAATHGVKKERLERFRTQFPAPVSAEPEFTRVIREGLFHLADIANNPEATAEQIEYARLAGYRTRLMVPMLRGPDVLGVIAVTREEASPFSDEQVELLKTFADQAVIAIENVRLFNETKEALEQETATAEILGVIASSPTDIQPVLRVVAQNAARICAARDVLIQGLEGDTLRVWAEYGPLPTIEGESLPLNRATPAGRAVVDRRTIHVADLQAEVDTEFPAIRQLQKRIGTRTVLATPLVREGVSIGAIVMRRLEVQPFSARQIELVKTFADQAVIAIENVRLFKELQARTADLTRSVGELRALGEVGQAISSTLDLRTVLSTIVARATELSGTDAGVVYEYDEQREVFLPRATARLETEIIETMLATPVRKGEGATGRLAEAQEPIQVPDILAAPAESRVRSALVRAGYRALLAVPLVREGHLIGGLTVIRKATGTFASEVVELLQTFATQSSLAIQNARLFREIEEKSHQLEVASQHKSEFLANMSHELRTPLNAIIGFSEVLSERMFGELNEKQEEYLKDIYASGTHLLSLINDILDLSKIEAGRMELELSDFHLPTALDNALTLVRERAGRRSIALHLSVDERLGQIQGDERKVRQVVLNLLSNAIKFTPEGGRIEVRATPQDGLVEVSVSDTGVGIAPEDQEAVFEEFRQVGTADKKVEGTGLGLTLCRKFVELHGGKIWVKSQVGVGSTFTFTIPVRCGE